MLCHKTQPTNLYIYIYIYIYSSYSVWKHMGYPALRGDDTVLVAQGGIATPGTTKQLLPPDRVLRELYIYIYIYIMK